MKRKLRSVASDLPHLQRRTGRSVEVQRIARRHAQQLEHLGHEADIRVGYLVMRVSVEDQLAGRPLMTIRKGYALADVGLMLIGVQMNVEIVTRQPGRHVG